MGTAAFTLASLVIVMLLGWWEGSPIAAKTPKFINRNVFQCDASDRLHGKLTIRQWLLEFLSQVLSFVSSM